MLHSSASGQLTHLWPTFLTLLASHLKILQEGSNPYPGGACIEIIPGPLVHDGCTSAQAISGTCLPYLLICFFGWEKEVSSPFLSAKKGQSISHSDTFL